MSETERENYMKKFLNIIFAFIFVAVLISGLISALFFAKDVNKYENRPANKMPSFSFNSFINKDFQEKFDDALNDQLPFSESLKKLYNKTNAEFESYFTEKFVKKETNGTYINLGNIYIFGGDHYVDLPIYYEDNIEYFESRINNINNTIEKLPYVDFYTYYIEKETDIDFSEEKRLNVAETVLEQIKLPDENKGYFKIDNFEDFDKKFLKTDTHWNSYGAYLGYCDVLKLIMPEETPVLCGEQILVTEKFSGNKASINGALGVWTEPFYTYDFTLPDMEYYINGEKTDDYGDKEKILSGISTDITYGTFFGGDNGETIIKNPNGNGEKLLIIGESFDNAILKLIASHTSEMYSIDLRNYKAQLNKEFILKDFLEEHGISKVLLIGNMSFYFSSSEFDMEVEK